MGYGFGSGYLHLSRGLHQRFFDPAANAYGKGEQAYQAMPLLFNMVPTDKRAAVMKNLEDAILVKRNGHLDTGMHGTYFVIKQLMEADRNDLIYAFTSKTDYPSWGNMLAQGATTMWESWTGGSHIHDTLISIGSWFIQGIGGIRIEEKSPGFTHFFIKPAVVGDLSFARTSYNSIHGKIVSNWRKENNTLHLDVTVPAGTTATVLVPAESGRTEHNVGPGTHQFTAKLAR
jgi:alpha-L-rhamnosidase